MMTAQEHYNEIKHMSAEERERIEHEMLLAMAERYGRVENGKNTNGTARAPQRIYWRRDRRSDAVGHRAYGGAAAVRRHS